MARPSSTSSSKSTAMSQPPVATAPTDSTSIAPAMSLTKSLYRAGFQSRQRRMFLNHLTKWSLDHDASLHFQGKISLLPRGIRKEGDIELGKPVMCVLTDTSYTDARQIIVIKLFPPQENMCKLQDVEMEDARKDSMELYDRTPQKSIEEASTAHGRYKLVIRCGAGWMSSRDYFNKIYFSRLGARPAAHLSLSESLETRSKALGPPPSDKDSVTIRPLFHLFHQLPAELQEMVLKTAAGLTRSYNLCSDDYGIPSVAKNQHRSAISLSTMFQISEGITKSLLPFVYHSTDFHFGLTGFTNFLWQSGPVNRREVRRLTFHFGKLALLHCIRWMAPDPVFELLEPPVSTNPRSLQYFWRCQIQDLAKDLDLLTLTIDINHIPVEDLPMIISIMKGAFGGVQKLRFVEDNNQGSSIPVMMDDPRLKAVGEDQSWREMCLAYYRKHRVHSYFFKFELLKGDEQAVEDVMNADKKFYDGSFSPAV